MIHLALIDYGAGNLHSLRKGLEAGGAAVTITSSWEEALSRDGLILPGVGSFGSAVRGLEDEGERVREALEGGLPCLGICLGMQLLFEESEEASGFGIGFISGRVRKLQSRIVPQMGWNDVTPEKDPIFGAEEEFPAYYANSFICEPGEREGSDIVIARSEYEGTDFVAGIRKGMCWGLQFHPEKSSDPGLRILANFVSEVEAAQ